MENGDKTKREESGADNNSQNSQALIDAINMRSMSLITLTSIATLYFIDWAQAVLLPLVVAVAPRPGRQQSKPHRRRALPAQQLPAPPPPRRRRAPVPSQPR